MIVFNFAGGRVGRDASLFKISVPVPGPVSSFASPSRASRDPTLISRPVPGRVPSPRPRFQNKKSVSYVLFFRRNVWQKLNYSHTASSDVFRKIRSTCSLAVACSYISYSLWCQREAENSIFYQFIWCSSAKFSSGTNWDEIKAGWVGSQTLGIYFLRIFNKKIFNFLFMKNY